MQTKKEKIERVLPERNILLWFLKLYVETSFPQFIIHYLDIWGFCMKEVGYMPHWPPTFTLATTNLIFTLLPWWSFKVHPLDKAQTSFQDHLPPAVPSVICTLALTSQGYSQPPGSPRDVSTSEGAPTSEWLTPSRLHKSSNFPLHFLQEVFLTWPLHPHHVLWLHSTSSSWDSRFSGLTLPPAEASPSLLGSLDFLCKCTGRLPKDT